MVQIMADVFAGAAAKGVSNGFGVDTAGHLQEKGLLLGENMKQGVDGWLEAHAGKLALSVFIFLNSADFKESLAWSACEIQKFRVTFLPSFTILRLSYYRLKAPEALL